LKNKYNVSLIKPFHGNKSQEFADEGPASEPATTTEDPASQPTATAEHPAEHSASQPDTTAEHPTSRPEKSVEFPPKAQKKYFDILSTHDFRTINKE